MTDPKWIELAKSKIGQHEIAGPAANSFIVECHQTTTLRATSDEVPWCSSFVNWCITKAGLKGTNSAAASSWIRWGQACTPQPGAICVIGLKTGKPDPTTGSPSASHVAFIDHLDDSHVWLLGGNQHDAVNVTAFPLSAYKIISCRLPAA